MVFAYGNLYTKAGLNLRILSVSRWEMVLGFTFCMIFGAERMVLLNSLFPNSLCFGEKW